MMKIIAVAIMGLMLLYVPSFTQSTTTTSQIMASPHVTTTNISDSLWAYAIANSNESLGFEGSTMLGQTVLLPPQLVYYVISSGVSSVTIMVNGVNVVTGYAFSNFLSGNLTLAYGFDNLTFNIASSTLNAQRSITYSINVVKTAYYIGYLKQKQPSPIPLISIAAAVGGIMGAAVLSPFMLMWWKGTFDAVERKRGPITR